MELLPVWNFEPSNSQKYSAQLVVKSSFFQPVEVAFVCENAAAATSVNARIKKSLRAVFMIIIVTDNSKF